MNYRRKRVLYKPRTSNTSNSFFLQRNEIRHVDDPERVELLAARRAVLLAKEVGTSKLVLETDCAGAVSKLNNREVDRSAHGPLVEDIKLLLGEFEESLVTHVRRSCNGVAHRLAKEGCGNKLSDIWMGSPPVFVSNLVASDVDV
jgi:hypothetical protein